MIIRQYGKTYTIFDGLFSKWGLCVIAAVIFIYALSEIFSIEFERLLWIALFVGIPFIALSIWIIKTIIEKKREKEFEKEIEIFKAAHRRELEGLDDLEIYTIYFLYKNDCENNEIGKNNGIKHKNQKKL